MFGPPLVAQMVKNLPAMQETWVQALGQEDPLEKGMSTHSTLLAWNIPWTEKIDQLQFMGSQRIRHDRVAHTHINSTVLKSVQFSSVTQSCPTLFDP